MGYDWIFDVLADLRSFAQANGMTGLAAKADEAMKVAVEEVAAQKGTPPKGPPRRTGTTH